MNITIDNISPQIQYFAGPTNNEVTWVSNVTADIAAPYYYRSTFHLSPGDSDRMVFNFNGSAVHVYGSKWFNHGLYSCQVDGGEIVVLDGYSAPERRLVNQVLCSASNLALDREHSIVVTNLPRQTLNVPPNTDIYLDIDYLVVQRPASQAIHSSVIDDSSPVMRWAGSGWRHENPGSVGSFNNTGSITSAVGDTLTVSFNGSSIQLYGALGPSRGNYTVAIDGVQGPPLNGSYHSLTPRVALYSVTGLADGAHTLLLTNRGGASGNILEVDYAVVNSTIARPNAGGGLTARISGSGTILPGPLPSTSGASSPDTGTGGATSPNAGDQAAPPKTGAIVGGVVGGLAFLIVLAALLFCWRRRRRANAGEPIEYSTPTDLNGDEINAYRVGGHGQMIQIASAGSGSATATANSAAGGMNRDEVYSGSAYAPSGYATSPTNSAGPPPPGRFLNIPAPPQSDASSYPRSVAPQSTNFGAGIGPYGSEAYPSSAALTSETFPPTAFGRGTRARDTPQSVTSSSIGSAPLVSPGSTGSSGEIPIGINRHAGSRSGMSTAPSSNSGSGYPADIKHAYIASTAMPSVQRPAGAAGGGLPGSGAKMPIAPSGVPVGRAASTGASSDMSVLSPGSDAGLLPYMLPPDYEQSLMDRRD